MTEVALQASPRATGKTAAKAIRRQGLVPGVFYMNGVEPVPFSVHPLALRSIVYTADAKLVRLTVEGQPEASCVLKEVVFDPITDKIMHIDLLGVSNDRPVHVEVPVLLVGQSTGVRDGGVLEHGVHKLHVEVLPANMPEHIEVDVTNLGLGQSIHVGDLKLDNMRVLSNADVVVASCVAPRVAGETSTNEPSEPELVGAKGKKED